MAVWNSFLYSLLCQCSKSNIFILLSNKRIGSLVFWGIRYIQCQHFCPTQLLCRTKSSTSLVFWWIRQLASLFAHISILFKSNFFEPNLAIFNFIFWLYFQRWNRTRKSIHRYFPEFDFSRLMLTCQVLSDQVLSSVAKLITDRWKFWPHQNLHISFSDYQQIC